MADVSGFLRCRISNPSSKSIVMILSSSTKNMGAVTTMSFIFLVIRLIMSKISDKCLLMERFSFKICYLEDTVGKSRENRDSRFTPLHTRTCAKYIRCNQNKISHACALSQEAIKSPISPIVYRLVLEISLPFFL